MVGRTEQAYLDLRHRILDGTLEAGERLGEEELAESLAISRTPVREALRRLAAEGLVEVLPNRGARVRVWEAEDLAEIFDLRALIEAHGAFLAARTADDDLVARLTGLCEGMERAAASTRSVDLEELASLNREFHSTVVGAANSTRLTAFADSLMHVPVIMQTFQDYAPLELERSMRQHRDLVEAFRARDEQWAKAVWSAHLMSARHHVLRSPAHSQAQAEPESTTPDA